MMRRSSRTSAGAAGDTFGIIFFFSHDRRLTRTQQAEVFVFDRAYLGTTHYCIYFHVKNGFIAAPLFTAARILCRF